MKTITKNMKTYLVPLLLLAQWTFAQNNASKADDISRIALNTYIPERTAASLPNPVRNYLENKLSQIASSNGLGGSSSNPRFIITSNVNVVSKDITSSAPAMTSLALDVTLYIGDFQTRTKYASTSLSVKGVGQNESKAYIEALKQINPNSPAIRQFIDQGKTKIIEYYNANCDFLLKEAQALAAQNKYEEAIYKLMSVPDVCKDCYDKAMDAVAPVYKKYIDKTCLMRLSDARNVFHASPNFAGAENARISLSQIDPEASCYGEAKAFTDSVRTRILKTEKRDWDFMMKRYDMDADLRQQRIQAMKEVGVAYGNNQPQQQLIQARRDDWLY